MKATITIVGVGNRMAGISKKNNKEYDFTPVAFTYDGRGFAGVKAAIANIDASTLGGYMPMIGDTVEAVIHENFSTGQVYVYAVLG